MILTPAVLVCRRIAVRHSEFPPSQSLPLHAIAKSVVGIGSLAGVVTALEAAAASILGG
ncbi:hypothetical protein ACQP2U_27730 [Nocardia sp. CA-084685]|uniref:hypothetical protein n=1 Tax=Nocardia sp. CA-084685 TaxID=3239970 RepID=UPI003D965EEF